MPKNVSCNSFYMFMIETKKRLEARGERFPRGLEDVVQVAAEIWDGMSPEQKNVYKEKAKDYKKSEEFSAHKKEVRARLPKKLREGGAGPSNRRAAAAQRAEEEEEFVEPVPQLYPSEDEEAGEEFKKKKIKDRTEIIDSWRWNLADNQDGIYDMKCYIVSFVAHCRTNGYEFFPAEVAIAEFSLRNGLTHTYSRLLGPHSNIPPHLLPMAKESMNVHKIPFDTTVEGMTNDYVRVMEEILRFCRPSKNLRRLFCLTKEFNCVQGCIKFLQCEAKQAEIRADRINCIDDLFQLFCEWRDKACAPAEWRTFNDCDGVMPTAPFFNHPGLLCEYHTKEGVHRCALATVQRAAFYLLQRIQTHYSIASTEKHSPPPMPPGALESAMAAAASQSQVMAVAAASAVTWNIVRNSLQQQQQQHAERGHDDDGMSTLTETTTATRRTAAYEKAELDEMPKTLPKGLRRLAGFSGAPDCWQEGDAASGYAQVESSRAYREAMGSVGTGVTSVSAFNLDPQSVPSVDWNQNRDVRDYVFKKHKPPTQAAPSRSQEAKNVAPDFGTSHAPRHVRPRLPRAAAPEQVQNGNNTAGNMGQLTNEFGNMNFQQSPVVLPSPQNVAPVQTVASGIRSRHGMAPRVALPPNMVNNGSAMTRPSLPVAQSSNMMPSVRLAHQPMGMESGAENYGQSAMYGQSSSYQTGVAAPAPAPSRQPPVKTQSRVKQMLNERLRHGAPGQDAGNM